MCKLPVLSTSIQPRQLAWQFVSRSVSTVACRAVCGVRRGHEQDKPIPRHTKPETKGQVEQIVEKDLRHIETTSTTGGYFFTMVSLVWLILYVVLPNCMFNARARVKKAAGMALERRPQARGRPSRLWSRRAS